MVETVLKNLDLFLSIIGINVIIICTFSYKIYKASRKKRFIKRQVIEIRNNHEVINIVYNRDLFNAIYKIYKKCDSFNEFEDAITHYMCTLFIKYNIKGDDQERIKLFFMELKSRIEHSKLIRGNLNNNNISVIEVNSNDDLRYYINKYINSLCWEEKEPVVKLKDVYIEQRSETTNHHSGKKLIVNICRFLSDINFTKNTIHIITGKAGMGKTSLTAKFAYLYNSSMWMPDRKVFFVNARKFNNSNLKLYEYLGFRNSKDLKESIIWVDGIDELSSINKDNEISQKLIENYNINNMFILTTRLFRDIKDIKDIFSKIILLCYTHELLLYDDLQMKMFLEKYFLAKRTRITKENSYTSVLNFPVTPMTLYSYVAFNISIYNRIINEYELYRIMIESIEERKKYDSNIEHSIILNKIDINEINKIISRYMYVNNTLLISGDYSLELIELLHNKYDFTSNTLDLIKKYLGISILFNYNNNCEIEYVHSSIMEYFIANIIIDESTSIDKIFDLLRSRPLSLKVIDFIRDKLECNPEISIENIVKYFYEYISSLRNKDIFYTKEEHAYLFFNLNTIVMIKYSIEDLFKEEKEKENYINIANSLFEYMDLSNIDISNLRFNNLKTNIKAENTKFCSTSIMDSDFNESDFNESDFSRAKIEKTRFVKCKLTNITITNTSFKKCDFIGGQIRIKDKRNCNFDNCRFYINLHEKFGWLCNTVYFTISALLGVIMTLFLNNYFLLINPELNQTLIFMLTLVVSSPFTLLLAFILYYIVYEIEYRAPKRIALINNFRLKLRKVRTEFNNLDRGKISNYF